jgi:hypothetical protein
VDRGADCRDVADWDPLRHRKLGDTDIAEAFLLGGSECMHLDARVRVGGGQFGQPLRGIDGAVREDHDSLGRIVSEPRGKPFESGGELRVVIRRRQFGQTGDGREVLAEAVEVELRTRVAAEAAGGGSDRALDLCEPRFGVAEHHAP